MVRFSRCLMAAAFAVGIVSCSLGATTSVPKPAGLTDLTDDTASRVTTTSTGEWLKGPGTAFHNKGEANKDANFRVIKNVTALNFIYTFDDPTCVNGYAFCMFNNGMPKRAPLKWNIYGSNTFDPGTKAEPDGTWTLIDSRDNETEWGVTEYRYFAFGNGAAYKSYKVDILSPQEGHDNYIQFNFMEFFFDASAVVPAFGECTFVSDQDGEYELSGVISDIAPTALSLVLTPDDDGEAKSIVLDTPEVGVPFGRTVSVTGDGLSTTVWYSAKLVAENENGSSEMDLGRCWFGPMPRPTAYAKKIEFTVSDSIGETLGESTMTDFPVLVRLSSAAIDGFDPAGFQQDGLDLFFEDEDGNQLPFELDTFDPAGETLVWVKIPSLSASTKFTCYYGGPENSLNDPTDVWTGYLGVWHYNTTETTVPNATANANLDATVTSAATALTGDATPFGSAAVQGGAAYKVADYEPAYSVGNKFSVSGWFKMPSYVGASGKYATWVSKKVGLDWNATSGWYLQMNQSTKTCGLVESGSGETKYSSLPDVTQNWIYFHYVNDGGLEKVYFNGSTTPGINKSGGSIKASTTVFQMLAANQQGDEFRFSKSTWSALRTSLEYKSMKESGFLANTGAVTMDPLVPELQSVSLVRLESGEAKLSFTLKKVRSTVKAVFSATAIDDVEIDLGTVGADSSFERTFAFGGELPIGHVYTVKLVVANADNVDKSIERVFDPIYYGGNATISDCAKYVEIKIPDGFRGELTDFPLLVQVSETTIDGLSYSDFKQGGKDVFFVDESGSLLPYECETWNAEGVSRFWVRVPSASAGAAIKMYFGTEAPMPEPESGVWGDYVGVWHMNETTAGAVRIADSSDCGSDGTASTKSTVAADGVLGGARGMPINQPYGAVTVPKSAALDGIVPEFTVSGWVRPYTLAANWRYLFSRKSSDSYKSWGVQPRGSSGNLDKLAAYSNGTSDSDTQRAVFTTTGKFTANGWTKYAVIYTETTVALYLDGIPVATNAVKPGAAVSGGLDFIIGGTASSSGVSMGADHDEVRIRKGSVSADWVANEYAIEKGTLELEYGSVTDTDPMAPALEKPTLVRNGDGSFTFTARLFGGEGAVYAQYFDGVITVNQELTTSDAAYPKTYSAVATGLTAGNTYTYAVYGVNGNGSMVRMSGGIFHNGILSVVKTADANEKGLVPGAVVFSRENPGLAFPIPYAIGGTAEAGLVYEPLSGVATIPAGETSVEVQVKPLICPSVKEDATVTFTIETGLYGISETAGSAEVTIADLPPEVGYNTWTAQVDGKASTAGNWSEGRAPTEDDNVLFDGRFTVSPCEWDKDAPHAVASWTQREDFTGVVTVDTTFDTYSPDFTNLVVVGDVEINGGKLQQKTHGTSTSSQYRLMMTVGGDFTVGAAGTVSVAGLGRFSNQSWGGSAAHGGDNASGTTAQFNTNDPAYGDILAPMAVAHGSQSGTDSDDKKSHGGGALYLVVAGNFTNNGVVTADGEGHYSGCGAGGSIYIKAANIYGEGKYTSSVPAMGKTDGTGAVGSGGRIALVATGVNEAANISCTGRCEGWGRRGAAGTVYMKGAAMNAIRVKSSEQESWNMIQTTTPIPADGDTMNWKTCAKSIDLIGDWCAHLRLTQPLVKMNSLSLLSEASNRKNGNTVYYRQSDLDLAGKVLQVRSVMIDGVDLKLPMGDYTLEDAESSGWTWLKDSSHKAAVEDNPDTLDVDESVAEVPGTGILRIFSGGLKIILR